MTEIPVWGAAADAAVASDGSGVSAGLEVAIGNLSRELRAGRRRIRPGVDIDSIEIPLGQIALSAGAGGFDSPNVAGPKPGYNWSLLRLSILDYTTGSVTAYKNQPVNLAPPNSTLGIIPPSPAGVFTFGKAQQTLKRGERLTFWATGITGVVSLSILVTQVSDDWWGDYLL